MGLLDFLTSARQTIGGSSVAPGQAEAGETNPGIMGKLNYGGIPMSLRLGAAIEALQRIEHPDMPQARLALMARAKEQSDAEKKAAKEKAELQEKANRLADKLEVSNPELAAALREDPSLISDYGKGVIGDMNYKRDRADKVSDLNAGFAHAEKGWGVQSAQQEDRQQHDLTVMDQQAKIDAEKLKAEQARDDALRQGRKDLADMITKGFLEQTGVELSPPAVAPPSIQPGPQPIPTPMPGSVAPTPQNVPGLTQQPPAMQPQGMPELGTQPEEQGDAPPDQVRIWAKKFQDPDLTPTEAALLTTAFSSALSESAASGKDPDLNLALGAAAEVYRDIQKNRNDSMTAQAAADTADQKTKDALIQSRIKTAEVSAAASKASAQKLESSDSVLNAINDMEVAAENKDGILPSTGFGAGIAGYVPESNARAIYTALKTVNANMAFDRLQQMKEASPTGGALGQIAVQELEMLYATLAAIDPTDVNFKANVGEIKKRYLKIKDFEENLSQDIENLRKFPTEEHKKQFDDMYGVDYHLKFTGE